LVPLCSAGVTKPQAEEGFRSEAATATVAWLGLRLRRCLDSVPVAIIQKTATFARKM